MNIFGYSFDELKSKHHRLFCDKVYTLSNDYKNFLEELLSGKSINQESKRVKKDGTSVYLTAFYKPLLTKKRDIVESLKLLKI